MAGALTMTHPSQEGHILATKQVITPFPTTIDRGHFASYLSGLTDGEGTFSACRDRWRTQKRCQNGYRNHSTKFVIKLRYDDIEILKLIQSFWECGAVRGSPARGKDNPQAHLEVSAIPDLVRVVIPHFTRYPLLAKKRRDFSIWKEAVLIRHAVMLRRRKIKLDSRGRSMGRLSQWTEEEDERFLFLCDSLKKTRTFNHEGKLPVADESMAVESTIQNLLF